MGDRHDTRAAFKDISNTVGREEAPADQERIKREERNRKQREYRARKRAEETPEQREDRNRKQREYRAHKREETATIAKTLCDAQPISGCTDVQMTEAVISALPPARLGAVGKSPQQTGVSTMAQASIHQGQENEDPDESTYWLHRNDEYIRTQKPRSTECTISTLINTGATSSNSRSWKWYINLDATSKEKLLQQRRDYKRARSAENINQSRPSLAQEGNFCRMLATPINPRCPNTNDVEFDAALFEPARHDSDDEDHLPEYEMEMEEDGPKDFETMQIVGAECVFELYRVNGNCIGNAAAEDPYDFVYHNLPKEHHVLRKVADCQYCGAMRFEGESPGFCCRMGKIKVHIHDVPAELKRLFTSQVDTDAKYFRKHIRYFNSHFSFTSLGVTLDRRYCTAAGTGIYTFHVHGALYRLDHLVPGAKGPRHLQLYFYDTEHDETLSHRVKRSPDLDINIVRTVLRILQEGNPYVQTFNRVGAIPNLGDYVIELNTNVTPDQRRYNAPTTSQVAAIWTNGNDPQRCFDRSVLVYPKGEKMRYIKPYHGCYDALAYPLLNPKGETGWNKFMPYNDKPKVSASPDEVQNSVQQPVGMATTTNCDDSVHQLLEDAELVNDMQQGDDTSINAKTSKSSKFVTAREYYCFLMQVRKGLFNILLFGGRLFQQWAVDMYIKIESMRLDWYSNPKNQKLIRAELYLGLVDVISAGEIFFPGTWLVQSW